MLASSFLAGFIDGPFYFKEKESVQNKLIFNYLQYTYKFSLGTVSMVVRVWGVVKVLMSP